MQIGPYGSGGIELGLSLLVFDVSYKISFAPLSWGVCSWTASQPTQVAAMQFGPFKICAQKPIWTHD